MSKPDTLVILSPGFPKDEADTTCLPPQQVFVRNLKRGYPRLNIIILTFQYPYYQDEYQWNGISIISFGGQNKGGISRLLIWARVLAKLRKLNKQYRLIGLLSFWTGECALIAARFARKHRLKYYAWLLGQDAKTGNKFIARVKPEPENIIAISDFVATEFSRNYHIKPAHTIPVGIDPIAFDGASERSIDLLGAGSLIPLKRYDLLINLVDELRKPFPNIRAVICGDGPERDSLQNMIGALHLNENVKLMGELPHGEVLDLMLRARVFVHPSEYEGFSTVCLEALNAGVQVVSFVRAMQADIENWHIADSFDKMFGTVEKLLNDTTSPHMPVAPYLAKESVKAIMNLFDYNDSAIF
jgi:glycosyltransferase involved in cell wall biosynthesis